MAATVSRVKTERYTPKAFTFTALTTAGITVDFEGVDENTVLLFTATADDTTVTIEAGDGIQGVKALTLPKIEEDTYVALAVPSMEFKKLTGTNKGYLVIKGAATTSVAAVEINQL